MAPWEGAFSLPVADHLLSGCTGQPSTEVTTVAQDTRTAEGTTASRPSPCPVAETMRRVHEQLRAGAAPSFEAMLAWGVPEARGRA